MKMKSMDVFKHENNICLVVGLKEDNKILVLLDNGEYKVFDYAEIEKADIYGNIMNDTALVDLIDKTKKENK